MGTDVVALKVENFTQATLKIPKSGRVNTIMKCSDWDFNTSSCNSWTATGIKFKQDDSFVYFNVTEFSAYGGVELTVLNVQSYPMVGDYWTTRLLTKGKANLTIEAVNGTVFGEDLLFDSLKCGDTEIQTTQIQNGVFVENYSCNGTTYHRVKVISTGRHTQRFKFGDVVAYSKNLANQMPNIVSVEGKLTNSSDDNQNGTFNMTFRIYDVATGGNYLWKENIEEVSVDEGIFTARLGEVNPLDLDWNVPYYLEVQVAGDSNMTPRINLSSSPYSKSADRSFNLTCTDCIDETQIDTSGAFVIEGSLNITSKNMSMYGHAIVNLKDPINAQDAATKAYVDSQVGGATTSYGWTNSSGYIGLTTRTDTVNMTYLYVNNSAGKVSIATDDTTATLTVNGNLTLQTGATVNEFSIDGNLAGNSDLAVPTEQAVKTYVDNQLGGVSSMQGWTNSSGYVYLTTSTDEVNMTTLYVNNSNSRVGIGTDNPSKKLEVSNSTQGITFDPTAETPTINTTSGEDLIITSGTGNVVIQIG